MHVMHDAIMRMQPGADITGAIYAHNLCTRDEEQGGSSGSGEDDVGIERRKG